MRQEGIEQALPALLTSSPAAQPALHCCTPLIIAASSGMGHAVQVVVDGSCAKPEVPSGQLFTMPALSTKLPAPAPAGAQASWRCRSVLAVAAGSMHAAAL